MTAVPGFGAMAQPEGHTSLTQAELLRSLSSLAVASCQCGTRTPDHRWHTRTCGYRVLTETQQRIRDMAGWGE